MTRGLPVCANFTGIHFQAILTKAVSECNACGRICYVCVLVRKIRKVYHVVINTRSPSTLWKWHDMLNRTHNCGGSSIRNISVVPLSRHSKIFCHIFFLCNKERNKPSPHSASIPKKILLHHLNLLQQKKSSSISAGLSKYFVCVFCFAKKTTITPLGRHLNLLQQTKLNIIPLTRLNTHNFSNGLTRYLRTKCKHNEKTDAVIRAQTFCFLEEP